MRSIIIFISLLLPLSPSALADNNRYLSCGDYDYLSSNLEEVEGLSQSVKVELLSELIQSTDPKCFE